MKCIVHNCKNHLHEGVFVGNICSPCYDMITTGKVGPSTNFIYELSTENYMLREKIDKIFSTILE